MDSRVIIKTLRLENFGCYRDETVKFGADLNQLIGPNEGGKSILLKALFTVIFEDGATTKQSVSQYRTWGAERGSRLTLVFSIAEKTFTLVRNYETGKDSLTDSDGIDYEGKAVGEKLSRYFGTSQRILFEAVFCFTSDYPHAVEKQREKLKAALEIPVFSGFDRLRADQKLDEEIKALDNPRAHGPTELDKIGEEITTRLHEKSTLDDKLRTLENQRTELLDVQAGLEQYESEVVRLEREIEGAQAYHRLNERMDNLEIRLHTHLANYSRASQVADDLVKIDKEIIRLAAASDEEYGALILNRDLLTEKVDTAKQAMDDLGERRGQSNVQMVGWTAVLLVIALINLGIQLWWRPPATISIGILLTIPTALIFWSSQLWNYLKLSRQKSLATRDFRAAVLALDAFYAEINNRYDLRAADPLKALGELNQKRQALLYSAENLRQTINHLSEGQGLEYLANAKLQIEIEVAQINHELDRVISFAASASRLTELQESLTANRVRANKYREQSALLNERCGAIEPLRHQVRDLNDAIEALKRRHVGVTERLEILKITRIALNRAADRLIEETFASYSRKASRHIARLSEGRYDALRFRHDAAAIEVKSPESNQWREAISQLSSSTRDAVFLALRLAAAEDLSVDFAPPMFFDFADNRLDLDRKRRFYEMLDALSKDRQIFYLGMEEIPAFSSAHLIRCRQAAPAPAPVAVG